MDATVAFERHATICTYICTYVEGWGGGGGRGMDGWMGIEEVGRLECGPEGRGSGEAGGRGG